MVFIIDNTCYTFLDDFMGNVKLPDGSSKPRTALFPGIAHVNFHSGYVVLKDGTICCSESANWYVAQYDGSKTEPF